MLFFFKTLVGWRKFILSCGVLATAIMVALSFWLPKWYTAVTSIFPPETKTGIPIYAELMENLQMPLLGPMATGARPETIHIDIMKSRAIGERIIEEFDLYRVYGVSIIEDALRQLHSKMGFTLLDNGLLIITFEDRDPERAAAVANRMVELLDEFNRTLNVSRASRTKEFIEGQLEQRKTILAEAETALREFQESHQALELDEQIRSAMDIVGQLTGTAIELEIELKILSHYTSPTSEEYTRKKNEYDEILAQLSKLKVSRSRSDGDLLRAYIPTLEEVPELALQMMRLRRTVDIETAVYTMLIKEYEKSRIEEARDTPTLQVMDPASVPNLKSRPKRKALVVVGALVGLGWGAFLAVFITAWRENKDHSAVFTEVLNPVFSDFARVFRRK